MSTATSLEKAVGLPMGAADSSRVSPDSELSVFVIFTSIHLTLKALEKAREIAKPLGASILVVAAQVVPFPLRLDEPPVPIEFIIRRFEEMAAEFPEKIEVAAYLCRDPVVAFRTILIPYCPVVIGLRKRWWPTRYERLARKLRRAGFNLHLVKAE